MKKIYLILSLVLSYLFCFSQTFSFTYQGQSRSYIVHLPTGYVQGEELPLVLNFHGYTSNAGQQESLSGFDDVADTAHFIVVYPEGISNAWNAGIGFNGTIDDVGFASALIDTLHKNYNIDLKRVYSTGFSNGGFMSHRLACQLSNRIAAIGAVSGTIGTAAGLYTCIPTRKVPVLHIHGTSDAVVSYTGASFSTSVDSTIKFWTKNNGCPQTPIVTELPNTNTGDGTTVTKYYYGLCSDSTEVILLKINGGSHSWPGTTLVPGANMDIKASEEIWNFFKKHHLPNPINAIENDQNNVLKEPINIQMNPFSEKISLYINSSEINEIRIYDILGNSVFETKDKNNFSSSSLFEINSNHFKNGVYLLKVKNGAAYATYKIIKL